MPWRTEGSWRRVYCLGHSHRPVTIETVVPVQKLELRRRRSTWVWEGGCRSAVTGKIRPSCKGQPSQALTPSKQNRIPGQHAALRTKVSLVTLSLWPGCYLLYISKTHVLPPLGVSLVRYVFVNDNSTTSIANSSPTTTDRQWQLYFSSIFRHYRSQSWARQRQTDNATIQISSIIRLYRSQTWCRQRQTDKCTFICSSTTDNRQCRSTNSLSICRIVADSAQLCVQVRP